MFSRGSMKLLLDVGVTESKLAPNKEW